MVVATETTTMCLRRLAAVLLAYLVFACPPVVAATPQGTAFTYQGELRQNGVPASGNVDMTFALFDAAASGNQVGPTLAYTTAGANPVAVSAGVFTVTLDFGALAFNTLVTDERYLAVSVNGNALAPRTKIENAPYALQSRSAELAYSVSTASIGSAQVVASQVQLRVTGACAANESIQSIAQSGSVVCHVDADSGTITGVSAGTGLSGGGVSGQVALAVANPLQLDGTDANGVLAAHNTTTSGLVRAIVGTNDSDSGAAIKGVSTSAASNGSGVAGLAASSNASGVTGQSSAATGVANGVLGYAVSTNGNGVFGWEAATSGDAWGVGGQSSSPDGAGVVGTNYATTGSAHGLRGISSSTEGTGVFGSGGFAGVFGASARAGVEGQSDDATGAGLRGYAIATSGANIGVFGATYSSNGHGVEGTATSASGTGVGVYGSAYSASGTGVYGAGSNGSTGVYAWSGSSGYGLNAYSFGGNAVLAQSDSANVNIAAVRAVDAKGYGLAGEGGNIGVYAHNLSGTPGRDAYLATAALAGDFYGGVWVHGTLTKSAGTFKIDHPLDPANRFLSHSFVESPDMKNIYDGVATLDGRGEAWIDLPAYFEALNRDFRYQLTALDQPAPGLHVARRIEANRFKLAGGAPGQQVSWQVAGTRKDAYAEAHRTPIEEDKAPGERGRYIAPELFGQPDTSALTPGRLDEDLPATHVAASAGSVDAKPLTRPVLAAKPAPARAPSP
jgi:hypothetical protein